MILVLFSIVPHDKQILEDKFDKVELNHFYDDQGRHTFDQVIWYDWDHLRNQHKVESWRLVKSPEILPVLNRNTNKYESLFYDKDAKFHLVIADYYIESWTQYDVELVDRENYDKDKRKDLKTSKEPQKPANAVIPGIIRALEEIP